MIRTVRIDRHIWVSQRYLVSHLSVRRRESALGGLSAITVPVAWRTREFNSKPKVVCSNRYNFEENGTDVPQGLTGFTCMAVPTARVNARSASIGLCHGSTYRPGARPGSVSEQRFKRWRILCITGLVHSLDPEAQRPVPNPLLACSLIDI